MSVLSNLVRRHAACSVVLAAAGAAIAFTAPVRADHDRVIISKCGPSQGGYGSGYRHRSYEEMERDRGYAAGSRAGWREGWEDGYYSRPCECACAIDLSCESRWFRRAFIDAFERSYDAGHRAGAMQRERERCASSRYPHRAW
jgi:hypothetical protein